MAVNVMLSKAKKLNFSTLLLSETQRHREVGLPITKDNVKEIKFKDKILKIKNMKVDV